MPIRFRCVYCNQLLSISSRKSGSTVQCTNCDGQIIVPEPVRELAAKHGSPKGRDRMSGSHFFESNDFDQILSTDTVTSPADQFLANDITSLNEHPRTAINLSVPTKPTNGTRRFVAFVAAAFAIGGFLLGYATAKILAG